MKKILSYLLKSIYVLAVLVVGIVLLEFTARSMGLGDPIIYYNSVWGGLRPLPNQQVSRIDGAQITIDNNGFRTANTTVNEALRILYLGDSVTWGGSSVDDLSLFTEVASDVLREAGHDVYAMNAGVNGTSLMNHAEVYEQHKDSIDAVVWLFPWGDVTRTYVTGGFLWPPLKKPRYALVEAIDQVFRAYWLPRFRLDEDDYKEAFLAPEIPQGYGAFYEGVFQEREQKNIESLYAIAQDATNRSLPILIGISPSHTQGQLDPLLPKATRVLTTLDTMGVHLLDMHAVLETHQDIASLYIDPVHYNTLGHEVIGQELGQAILSKMGSH